MRQAKKCKCLCGSNAQTFANIKQEVHFKTIFAFCDTPVKHHNTIQMMTLITTSKLQ